MTLRSCWLAALMMLAHSAAAFDVTTVRNINDIPKGQPSTNEFRLHLIDVGTGLSILLQGDTWNLLFDAGSNDDSAGGTSARTIAYLYEAVGPSGDNGCRPSGVGYPSRSSNPAQLDIQHVFQSHPHKDHGVLLDEVLDCYNVLNFWDSGAPNNTRFYRRTFDFLNNEANLQYRTATPPPASGQVTMGSATLSIPTNRWSQFFEGQTVNLGTNASFTILHAATQIHSDLNENSIVIRVDAGNQSILLTGDAGSGSRQQPSSNPGAVEAHLIANHITALDVDILQIGHHGSLTSTREAFLNAVDPTYALISAGPKRYGSVRLPDDEVVDLLLSNEVVVLRTDLFDGDCPEDDRVGRNRQLGGCTNYVLNW